MTYEPAEQPVTDRESILERYRRVREWSLELAAPLRPEEYRIQSMPDVSPPWWNLGHTTWFFAKNILEPRTDFRFDNPGLEFALNSYYETHGARLARDRRGQVSRPTTDEVLALRSHVDERMLDLLDGTDEDGELAFLVETGIQHEQQHQELMVTEIQHILSCNPPGMRATYAEAGVESSPAVESEWLPLEAGIHEVGAGDEIWAWDNERPRHRVFCEPFEIQSRLVTVGEYLEFVHDGGYEDPLLWLANGWALVREGSLCRPLYWEEIDDRSVRAWTLAGPRELSRSAPVSHVSYYEADAFANWKARQESGAAGFCRLPTEVEWEVAVDLYGFDAAGGTFLDDRLYRPRGVRARGWQQAAGDLWEWTSSHYEPYPGYRPFDGDLMEYNGKFMDNQRVLRGGSCATPRDHIRSTYRNFWPAETQFQFTGFRLARSAG